MPVSVELIYDFGSPNAYLAYQALQAIAERTGAKIVLTPCLLGGVFKATGNQSPFMAFANVKGKLDYDRLEFQRFITRHKLTRFQMNPHFPVNTLLLMRGAIAAQKLGVHDEYFAAGMAAMWENGHNMSDPEVFAQTMSQSGLDGPALLAATQDPDIKQGLLDATTAVVERGVFGSPTLFVGKEMFFGKERLGQVEQEIRQHSAKGD